MFLAMVTNKEGLVQRQFLVDCKTAEVAEYNIRQLNDLEKLEGEPLFTDDNKLIIQPVEFGPYGVMEV